MLKDFNIIENIPDDCKDVFAEGMLKHYNMPEALEETCLADLVSWYRRKKIASKTSKKQKQLIMENDDHHTDDDDPDENTSSENHDLHNGYQLVRRRKQLCIRYVRFHVEKDTENHYREILMLFQPWRDESEIIGSSETYLEQFRQLTLENLTIITKMEEYSRRNLIMLLKSWKKLMIVCYKNSGIMLHQNTQHVENQDDEVKVILPHSHTDPEYNSPEAVELNIGLGVPNTADKESIKPNMMKDED
jgi:hypothetical protein